MNNNKQIAGSESRLDAFVRSHERAIILILCLIAAVRIFGFATAFPPFNNVDEFAHYDLVYKYAHGQVPAGLRYYSMPCCAMLARYGTLEYINAPQRLPFGKIPPPVWTMPPGSPSVQQYVEAVERTWHRQLNTESTQPPVYYALAGGWYQLGRLMGIRGGFQVYWLRLLNIPLFLLLMWCAYALIGHAYPGSRLLRVGVPLLLAFSPQDVFYSISNDVLSPLLFCVSFYCMLQICGKSRGYLFYALTGLSVSATVLVKFTNLAILAVFAVVLIISAAKQRGAGKLRTELPKLGTMTVAALLPLALWLLRNIRLLHDFTGSSAKAQCLGWTAKPLGQMMDHPIFTPTGLFTFLRDLISSFWRGEIAWYGLRIADPNVDAVFCWTTVIFLLAVVARMLLRRSSGARDDRLPDRMSLLTIGISAAILVGLSIAFDFGHCYYPSPSYPYVTSGRLMLGALVPFLVLYIKGLDLLMERIRPSISRYAVLLVIAAIMLIPDIALTIPAFMSRYNWFHML